MSNRGDMCSSRSSGSGWGLRYMSALRWPDFDFSLSWSSFRRPLCGFSHLTSGWNLQQRISWFSSSIVDDVLWSVISVVESIALLSMDVKVPDFEIVIYRFPLTMLFFIKGSLFTVYIGCLCCSYAYFLLKKTPEEMKWAPHPKTSIVSANEHVELESVMINGTL